MSCKYHDGPCLQTVVRVFSHGAVGLLEIMFYSSVVRGRILGDYRGTV